MHVLSLPAIFALELTAACNNRCPGCSNVYATDRAPRPMSATDWEALLGRIGPEAVQFRLTGGEPTLHSEFARILSAVTSYDAGVTLFTNGRWRDPLQFVALVRGRARLSGLLVSLHGARAEHHEAFSRAGGSFDETVANIRLAVANGIPISLSTVLTRWNTPHLEEMLELRRVLGAQQIVFNRLLGRESVELEAGENALRSCVARIESWIKAGEPVKYGIGLPQCFELNTSEGCLAGVAYATIDPWGRLRPCSHSPTVIGSLHTASLSELWHSPEMGDWRSLMPEECVSCAAYAACHGGCRAAQELRNEKRDPLRRAPLREFQPAAAQVTLPARARPLASLRLRQEPFGFVVLSRGHAVPVRTGARAVIEACDGRHTFAQLAEQFGSPGLALLGELWERGLLDCSAD